MAEVRSGADSGGFFSGMLESLGAGFGTVLEQVVPRWVENELISQDDSKLFNPTRDGRSELDNIFVALERFGFRDPRTGAIQPQPTAFSGLGITDGLVFAAIAVGGLVLLLRR